MLVTAENISKRLNNFHLDQISMELPAGYICGLIGPNGAGKTTFLHVLLGLFKPDYGNLRIADMNYSQQESAVHEMTGTVLAEDLYEDSMTLRQNGNTFGKYYHEYSPDILDQYLTRFGLEGKRKYDSLSRGEKLKFQLAFALSHNARLLILDEPAANFDPDFRKEFFMILKEFIADGTRSVILSTHLTEDLERWADYILYLEKGKEIFYGDIETLRDSYRILTGEAYKLRLLDKDVMIHMEEGTFGAQALVRHRWKYPYDKSLTVTIPTIEELMYFMSKREKRAC